MPGYVGKHLLRVVPSLIELRITERNTRMRMHRTVAQINDDCVGPVSLDSNYVALPRKVMAD
jgi:hypothetical protein